MRDLLLMLLRVSCAQLTDNVTLSTSLALQRFTDSCTSAILQDNDRAAAVNDEPALFCPLCPPNYPQLQMCCGNGVCVNGTCKCDKGWYNQRQ